jgi:hypothetical protein
MSTKVLVRSIRSVDRSWPVDLKDGKVRIMEVKVTQAGSG